MCGSAGASNRFDTVGGRKVEISCIPDQGIQHYRRGDEQQYQSVADQSLKYVSSSNFASGFVTHPNNATQDSNANITVSTIPIDQHLGTSTSYYPRIDTIHAPRTNLPSKLQFLESGVGEYRDKVLSILEPFKIEGSYTSNDDEQLSRLSREWAQIGPSSNVTDDIIACFAGKKFTAANQSTNQDFADQASHFNHAACINHDYHDPKINESHHAQRGQMKNASVYNFGGVASNQYQHHVGLNESNTPSVYGTDVESYGQIRHPVQQTYFSNDVWHSNFKSCGDNMHSDGFCTASAEHQAQSHPLQLNQEPENFNRQKSQLDLLFEGDPNSTLVQGDNAMSLTLDNCRVANEDYSDLLKNSSVNYSFDNKMLMKNQSECDQVLFHGSQEGNEETMLHVRKRPKHEPRVKEFVEANKLDVLLGRGSRTNIHPGNQRYLVVRDMLKARYIAASNDDKTQISQELVDLVHSWGGRFLKLEEASDATGIQTAAVARQAQNNTARADTSGGITRGNWYEVLNIVARRKASQSLRDINTPEERAAKRRKYGLDKSSKNNDF